MKKASNGRCLREGLVSEHGTFLDLCGRVCGVNRIVCVGVGWGVFTCKGV